MAKFQTYYNRTYKEQKMWFCPHSSLTDQDYKMNTDINYLIAHMQGSTRTPLYGVQDNRTFEDWQNEVAKIKKRFTYLTPEQRAHFGTAQNFLKWCADPNNYKDELPKVKEEQRLYKNSQKEKEYQESQQDSLAGKIAKAIKGE